jgi:hypothetical protein
MKIKKQNNINQEAKRFIKFAYSIKQMKNMEFKLSILTYVEALKLIFKEKNNKEFFNILYFYYKGKKLDIVGNLHIYQYQNVILNKFK